MSYQEALHAYRKHDGSPLSLATQVQRLVPVAQFFTWLRREHRIELNPAADLLMPRPGPPTARGHPERGRDGSPAGRPRCHHSRSACEIGPFWRSSTRAACVAASSLPYGSRHRLRTRHRLRPPGQGRQGPLRPHRRTSPVLAPPLHRDRPAPLRCRPGPDVLFLSSVGTPLCADWLSRKVRPYLARPGSTSEAAATCCATASPP